MSAEQVLAVLSCLFATEELIGPGAVHQSIVARSLTGYLQRLEQLG